MSASFRGLSKSKPMFPRWRLSSISKHFSFHRLKSWFLRFLCIAAVGLFWRKLLETVSTWEDFCKLEGILSLNLQKWKSGAFRNCSLKSGGYPSECHRSEPSVQAFSANQNSSCKSPRRVNNLISRIWNEGKTRRERERNQRRKKKWSWEGERESRGGERVTAWPWHLVKSAHSSHGAGLEPP